MPGENTFIVEGVVIEVRSERTCQVRLANGHLVFCFARARECAGMKLSTGQKLILKLSPYDLSEGQIIVKQSSI